MSTGRRIVLFDLFGVIALHQRPGALEEMAAQCNAPVDAFTEAYWACRPAYDAARQSAPEYWTTVLRWMSRSVAADTIEELRLSDQAAPENFFFVDDRDENVRAAQAIGMNGHVFTGPEELAAAINTWLPTGSASPTSSRC